MNYIYIYNHCDRNKALSTAPSTHSLHGDVAVVSCRIELMILQASAGSYIPEEGELSFNDFLPSSLPHFPSWHFTKVPQGRPAHQNALQTGLGVLAMQSGI